jgi:DNA repair protein RecO (recombination protein O)
MKPYEDEAIVLRTYKLKDADKVVVLFTLAHGKVRSVVKGARNPTTRWRARFEPPALVKVGLVRGRGELQTVIQADLLDGFAATHESLDRMVQAASMLEATDGVAQEGHPDPALFKLLAAALRRLCSCCSPLVAPAFFARLLVLEGHRPVLERCASCGNEDRSDLVAFDMSLGGTLCSRCACGDAISPEAIAMFEESLGSRLGSLLESRPGPGAEEFTRMATKAVEFHLEKPLRSVRVGLH